MRISAITMYGAFVVHSGLSDGVTSWVMRQFRAGVNPRHLLETVLLPGANLVCVHIIIVTKSCDAFP